MRKQLNSKKSLLVIDKILKLFFNTFTGGHKYSFLNRDNLALPIQMHLSLKGKHFSRFFSPIFEISIKFWTFSRNMTLIADVFSKLRTQKTVVRYMSKKSRFWRPIKMQHGKRAQTLLKFEPQQLYIFIDQREGNWFGKSRS